MKGRIWLVLGIVAGVAVGLGKLVFFAGAASSLSETAVRVVGTGGLTVIHSAANHGAPRRAVEGLTAVLAVLAPGLTALLLVCAARSALRLRAVIGMLLGALGAAAFFYLPHGVATGVAVLALVAAGIAVAASGPLVAAPLAALAALIAVAFLPRVLARTGTFGTPVSTLHQALFASAGAPTWLQIAVLCVAVLPFAFAARLIVR